MATKPRNYKQEYATYQGKPEHIKERAERNKARSTLVKAGKLRKGDGKDAAHVKAIDDGGSIWTSTSWWCDDSRRYHFHIGYRPRYSN